MIVLKNNLNFLKYNDYEPITCVLKIYSREIKEALIIDFLFIIVKDQFS